MIVGMPLRVLSFASAFALVSAAPHPARPCAPAWPHNKPVAIADESAVIIWDADAKTQHFIRRASFKSAADDFGFLVPTPSKPELAEGDDALFARFEKITAPEIIERKRPEPSGGCLIGCPAAYKSDTGAPRAEVRVLEEKRVAGYDAAVLDADTAEVLAGWLRKNGYEFPPELTAWAAHYIKAGWKITAFKIAKTEPGAERVGTSSVRMSFKTDAPFFPYREPGAAPGTVHAPRLLRVFFVGQQRVEGAIRESRSAWPGKTVWAGPITASDLPKLPNLSSDSAKTWWLTEFEDASSPRPGTDDVYFAPAGVQEPVKRPPHIRYLSTADAGEVLAWYAPFAGLMLALGLARRRRTE